MDIEKNTRISIEEIQADRRLVDELSGHGLITQAAREHALQMLYPHRNWGLWVSRLQLVAGVSLVLAGIIYFFAFNWAKIGPSIKFVSIELSILGCLAIAYGQGVHRLSGKILLLSASVLVGVFLAVFGQIYQTGADAYTLFTMWAALITGWVLISEFAALWAVWLIVCNIALTLYWDQIVQSGHDMDMMITSIVAVFNLVFLGIREYFVARGVEWLSARWTRAILVIPILISLLIPTLNFIFGSPHDFFFDRTLSTRIGAALAVLVHVGLFAAYRYKWRDIWSLSIVVLSACVIAEAAGFKCLLEGFEHMDAALYLLTGLMTIGIFTFAIVALRKIARNMEVSHVR
ncbi:MAG: DUF2157 domain-containing protein [Alphaproteobacteria bacterium]|nr:DUF2157 domain-containing protein [Alphaproteobacteria bacterium]